MPSTLLSTRITSTHLAIFLFFLFTFSWGKVSPLAAETVLFDAATSKPSLNGVTAKMDNGFLRLANKSGADWPGLTVHGKWALQPNEDIMIEACNRGEKLISISCRFDSPGVDHPKGIRTYTTSIRLEPGETKICALPLPKELPPQLADKLFGMRGYPGGIRGGKDGEVGSKGLDRRDIATLIIFLSKPTETCTFGIKRVFTASSVTSEVSSANEALGWPPEKFFPMIDKFGQYKHADWPGKIHSLEELQKNGAIEESDLKQHPGPKDWNRYGGWAKGPKRQATGHFHAEKIDGRWWLIDPEGRLFWSHGCDCIRDSIGYTGIQDREFLFEEFPMNVFGTNSGGAHNYYKDKKNYKVYNFSASNLRLKYGEKEAFSRFADLAHRRLRSWGMNTIGNWSDPRIYHMKKTPYTATAGSGNLPVIEGSEGYWGKFRDPFHPKFRQGFAEAFDKIKELNDDPWCVGLFVDNEIAWGSDTSLALAALLSPADQPVKLAMRDWLRKKYEDVRKLNGVWGSAYDDWEALLHSKAAPDKEKAGDDLKKFYSLIAEEYFRVIREEFKKTLPNKMYFGCRFAWVNDSAVHASAKYCDVISFNKYDYSLESFKLPEGIDKGVIIGEFHFGALDRGMFHPGLKPTANQRERAAAYEKYVRSALENPWIVGTHWFLYGDQATTGRPLDGENYQVGLLDICDTPYPETIEAVRKIGNEMYPIRTTSPPKTK